MLLKIPDVLTADELRQITDTLATAEFMDGKLSAGWYAKQVQHNQQLKSETATAESLKAIIHQSLDRNALFQCTVRPRLIHNGTLSYVSWLLNTAVLSLIKYCQTL
ncbi:hypothetical protein [Trichothermofontia sp.]